MKISDYQKQALTTALPHDDKLSEMAYCALGLTGEAGEVADIVKKIIRDDSGKVLESTRNEVKKEMGDVLWYMAALASHFDLDLSEIAQMNLDKLASRKARGVLGGSGNDR